MNDINKLIGALSNDLSRVANLTFRGAIKGANRFLIESKKRSNQLKNHDLKPYLSKIVKRINDDAIDNLNLDKAEEYLMYSVLLQNYILHY